MKKIIAAISLIPATISAQSFQPDRATNDVSLAKVVTDEPTEPSVFNKLRQKAVDLGISKKKVPLDEKKMETFLKKCGCDTTLNACDA